jgi:hypothetical protein
MVWHVVSTRPAVPSAVSYADVRQGHAPSRACRHGPHRPATGPRTVRGRCLCPPQAERGREGREGAPRGTLAPRRPLRPAKAAARLGPPRHWSGDRVWLGPCPGPTPLPAPSAPRTRHGPPGGTWAARRAPAARQGGRSPGQPRAGRGGGGKSAGRPVVGRRRVATSPGAPARCLPDGVAARAPGRTRSSRCGPWRWRRATGAPCPVRASTALEARAASRWSDGGRVVSTAVERLELAAGRSSRQGCHRAGGSPAVSNAHADTERYHILRWVTPRAMRGVNGLAAQSPDCGGSDLEV